MSENIPAHIGLILDGNRRWAKEHGLPVVEGHRRAIGPSKKIFLHAFDQGVEYVSAWVFSTENWKRSKSEVDYLMNLIPLVVKSYIKPFNKAGIRLLGLGSRQGVPPKVIKALELAERETKNNTRGTLALCFNHGGRPEIVDAVKRMVEKGIKPKEINVETISEFVDCPEIPPLDLIIRTSGEKRTSGFMLWRSDYAELVFNDKYWPDFTTEDLDDALAEYANRQRRFGGK